MSFSFVISPRFAISSIRTLATVGSGRFRTKKRWVMHGVPFLGANPPFLKVDFVTLAVIEFFTKWKGFHETQPPEHHSGSCARTSPISLAPDI